MTELTVILSIVLTVIGYHLLVRYAIKEIKKAHQKEIDLYAEQAQRRNNQVNGRIQDLTHDIRILTTMSKRHSLADADLVRKKWQEYFERDARLFDRIKDFK